MEQSVRTFEEMYTDFIDELWGRRIIKRDYGFVSYELCEGFAYISDLYIEPEYRAKGYGKTLESEVIEIAQKAGYEIIQCKVHRSDKGWRSNYTIYTEHCGYSLKEENSDMIRLEKNIGGKL